MLPIPPLVLVLVCFPYDGDGQDQLIKNADTALYQSKGSGHDTLNFYSDYLQSK